MVPAEKISSYDLTFAGAIHKYLRKLVEKKWHLGENRGSEKEIGREEKKKQERGRKEFVATRRMSLLENRNP